MYFVIVDLENVDFVSSPAVGVLMGCRRRLIEKKGNLVLVGREDGIALNELQRRYNKRIIIQARIPRLLELGQLRLNGDRLVLGGRWVLAGAEAARLMRILLSIPPQPVQEDSPSHGRA
jgi:hypothetical protein